MEIEVWVIVLLSAVFFCTGIMDGIAGGGGLISLPAVLLSGLPPDIALGTNKVSAYAGVFASLGTYARSGMVCWKAAWTGVPATLVGAMLGSKMVLSLDNALLGKVLVFMLPIGIFAFFMPKKDRGSREMTKLDIWLKLPLLCLLLGFYDGFFGPGSGTFFTLGLHLLVGFGLLRAVATAKLVVFLGGVSGVIMFAVMGKVVYAMAIPLGICCAAGNILGSKIAMHVGTGLVRRFILISLVLLFASLVWKFWIAA